MLNKHEDVEYLYVFYDLATHKVANELHYAISKTNYFMSKESFYKQHEMLQEGVDGKDLKDQASVMNHIASLNKIQLKNFGPIYSYDEDGSHMIRYSHGGSAVTISLLVRVIADWS